LGGTSPPAPSPDLTLWYVLIVALLILAIIAAGAGLLFLLALCLSAALAVVAYINSPAFPSPPSPAPVPAPSPLPAGLVTGTMTPGTIAAAPQRPGFGITQAGNAPPAGPAPNSGPDSPAADGFRGAVGAVFGYTSALPADPAQAPALDLGALQTTLMTRLDPVTTVPRRIKSRITLPSHIIWRPWTPETFRADRTSGERVRDETEKWNER
jgi:hypothetical protein